MRFNAFRQKLKGEKDPKNHKHLSHLNTTRPVRSLISSCKFTMIFWYKEQKLSIIMKKRKKKTCIFFTPGVLSAVVLSSRQKRDSVGAATYLFGFRIVW